MLITTVSTQPFWGNWLPPWLYIEFTVHLNPKSLTEKSHGSYCPEFVQFILLVDLSNFCLIWFRSFILFYFQSLFCHRLYLLSFPHSCHLIISTFCRIYYILMKGINQKGKWPGTKDYGTLLETPLQGNRNEHYLYLVIIILQIMKSFR